MTYVSLFSFLFIVLLCLSFERVGAFTLKADLLQGELCCESAEREERERE